MPKAKTIGKILLFVACSFVLALIMAFVLDYPSNEVVAQWKQPADITYDGRGPYYVSVVERDVDWGRLSPERNYFIYVGRDAGEPSYGHMIKYSFHPDHSETVEQFLNKASAQWTEDGVTLMLRSGHRLFVPKQMFIGGR